MAYTDIIYGEVTLKALRVEPRQIQSTLKYKVGKTLVKVPTPTRDAFDWEIRISGVIDTTIDATRANLEALNDVAKHTYSDGLHSGDFIMEPGSLLFTDDQDDTGMIYRYSFTLIEYNQT